MVRMLLEKDDERKFLHHTPSNSTTHISESPWIRSYLANMMINRDKKRVFRLMLTCSIIRNRL